MKLSVTIKQEQEQWIEKMLNEGKFYNRSHIVQEGIRLLQENGEKN